MVIPTHTRTHIGDRWKDRCTPTGNRSSRCRRAAGIKRLAINGYSPHAPRKPIGALWLMDCNCRTIHRRWHCPLRCPATRVYKMAGACSVVASNTMGRLQLMSTTTGLPVASNFQQVFLHARYIDIVRLWLHRSYPCVPDAEYDHIRIFCKLRWPQRIQQFGHGRFNIAALRVQECCRIAITFVLQTLPLRYDEIGIHTWHFHIPEPYSASVSPVESMKAIVLCIFESGNRFFILILQQ